MDSNLDILYEIREKLRQIEICVEEIANNLEEESRNAQEKE